MNAISRGMRNAFRNGVRTTSIVIILGLSVGLGLTMVVANKAVSDKIASVKSGIGNTISIRPAGFSDFSQVNNALTTGNLAKVQQTAHITSVSENLNDRLFTTGSAQPNFGFGRGDDANLSQATTSLTSPVRINASGNDNGGRSPTFINGGGNLPANFTPPVSFLGTTDTAHLNNTALTLKSGQWLDGGKDSDQALISADMASQNNLSVGGTFTAYNATLTVAGIFDSGSQAGNGTVILSLPALQRLSGQSGAVTDAVATVDSIDNLSSATTAVKNTLGSSADVSSSQDQADNTVKPLNSVKTISVFGVIGALVAGAVIIFLTMLMVARERKREIGVMKAIGGPTSKTVLQFISEAITLTLLGLVVGLGIGVIAATPVTKTLVNNSSSSNTMQVRSANGPGGFGGFRNRGLRALGNNSVANLRNIKTQVGFDLVGYGLAAALVIAAVGSAIPAYLISKVRPAEVMRSE